MKEESVAQLMVSVSGIRGIYGDGLSDEAAERFSYAFGETYPGTIVVGRDSRTSGEAITRAVVRGLRKAGCRVIDLGLASTPTTEMAVTAQRAAGGVIVTASHNPPEWNGLKFLGPDGVFLTAAQGAEVLARYETAGSLGNLPESGTLASWDGASDHHIDRILELDLIDVSSIISRRYTVALDPNHGAGGPICTRLLERLGCTVHVINPEPTGVFAHGAEPLPENLSSLCGLVKETGSAIGFAVDPDVDRLSLVDDRGIAPGEEFTLALAAEFLMAHGVRAMACNLSTSRMIDDVAAMHGGAVHRSAVGEINVVEVMRAAGADAGGEGNGGVILPALHPGRDAVLGIALMLQLMTSRNRPLSALVDDIPHYSMIKEKTPVRQKGVWREPVLKAFPDAAIDSRDGLKIIYPDSWVHVRESNTEPVVRVIAEAPTEQAARSLIEKVYRAIR
jgi:phosphomannomutase